MENKYLRTDWDIVALRYKDGTIITEGEEFEKSLEFLLTERLYSEKISYYPEIYSVRNNKRNGEILSLGDDLYIKIEIYEDDGTLYRFPDKLNGKITKLWASFEQMRIDVGNGGLPLSEITGLYGK